MRLNFPEIVLNTNRSSVFLLIKNLGEKKVESTAKLCRHDEGLNTQLWPLKSEALTVARRPMSEDDWAKRLSYVFA